MLSKGVLKEKKEKSQFFSKNKIMYMQQQGMKRAYVEARDGTNVRRAKSARTHFKKVNAKPSQTVKNYVKNYVSLREEKKTFEFAGFNNLLVGNIGTVVPNNICLLPLMSQGSAEAQRVGGSIRVKKAYVKFAMNLQPSDATLNPTANWAVRCMIVKSKYINTTVFSGTQWQDIWSLNNTDASFQGNIGDCLLDINKAQFRVYYDEVIQLNYSSAISGSAGGGTNSQAFDSQGAYWCTRNIDFTKNIKKVLQYDGTTGGVAQNTPTNENLFLIWQPVPQDGTSCNVNERPVETHFVVHYQYTDA